MNKKIIISIVFFIFMLAGCQPSKPDVSFTDADLAKPLEPHPELKSGVLANGLRYYVLKTESGTTALKLNINVGSVDENDDQRGYAHLVEHMAFQGTPSHSFEELQNLYRDLGMTFGSDVNASTSLYKTRYFAELENTVTSDSEFERFADWLADVSKGKLLFPEQQLNTEKTVVNSERIHRQGNTYSNKSFEKFIEGAGIELQLPLGMKETVASATASALKSFVNKYYVPSNSTLVVVGNITDQRLEYIKKVFGGNERPVEKTKREHYRSNLATFFYQENDADAFSHANIVGEIRSISDQDSLLKGYLAENFGDFLYKRLRQSNDNNDKVTFGIDVSQTMVGNRDATSVTFDHGNDSHNFAIQMLTQELTRLRQHGLTDAEYDEFKKEWQDYEVSSEDQYSSLTVANTITARIETNGVYQGYLQDAELVKAYTDIISKQQLEQYVAEWASGPVRWGFSGPKLDEASLKSQIEIATRVSVPPPTDLSLPIVPVPQILPATIIKEEKEWNRRIWHLSNGVKVILEPRSYSDRISFLMVSKGGLNGMKTIESYDAARLAPAVFSLSGQNWIKPAQMEQLLVSKKMSLHPIMDVGMHGIEIQSEAEDRTLALSILYNAMQNAVVNPSVFQQVQKNTVDSLQTLTPNQIFHHKLNHSRSGQEAIRVETTAERFAQANVESVEQLYRDLYQQVDGYTLIVVGKFTPEAIRSDILSFVGGLPKGERYINRAMPEFQKPLTQIVEATGHEKDKTHIHYGYTSPVTQQASVRERVAFKIIANALYQRLFDALREENGWVYNVTARYQYNEGVYNMNLLDADILISPQYQDEVLKEIDNQFELLKNNGITDKELAQFKGEIVGQYPAALSDDLSTTYVYANELKGIDYRQFINYEAMFLSLTKEYVDKVAVNALPESGLSIGIFKE